ncbi:hypothetical protein ACMHYO_11605 [Allopusillimonas ginsengisoli]|uniref:hypothetical protein n=1 Tax=Allopusillimonas ginsengisoli TaxID=453575 RepID=UPI0039C49616
MATKTDDWMLRAAEAVEKAKAQRAAHPARRNAEQIVDTSAGVAFVTLDPVPCHHEFDQDTEACIHCGMSIWSHAFRECP